MEDITGSCSMTMIMWWDLSAARKQYNHCVVRIKRKPPHVALSPMYSRTLYFRSYPGLTPWLANLPSLVAMNLCVVARHPTDTAPRMLRNIDPIPECLHQEL
jgi:hypothetical protein